ncbi:MAG: thioredoxin domain-containing protein [Gemmatimonadota bacterium]
MKNTFDRAVSGTMAVAAILVALTFVYKTFDERDPDISRDVEYVDGWEEVIADAHLVAGKPDAPIAILVFTDFECPACRGFHSIIDELMLEGQPISVYYAHSPLDYHRFALPAAKAAECAAGQAQFVAWADVVFAKQDSLGLKSWESFAIEAGIDNPLAIQHCATDPTPVAKIDRTTDFARQSGSRGTPAVHISGWRYSPPPSVDEIKAAIGVLLAGDIPTRD